MQAVTVAKTSADPRDLVIQDVPVPDPGPGQVRVAVHAVSINPVDWKLAESGHPRWTMPHVLGLDAAGVIEEIGSEVTGWKPGQRVFWHGNLSRPGVFADFALADAHVLAEVPDDVSFEAAAALPCAAMTAYQGLFRKAHLEAGQAVLVQGASGGVGGFAVQLAKAAGARVIALCSPAKADRVKTLGADTVLDYRDPDLARKVKDLTGGYGADVMVEVANPGDARKSLDLVAYNGDLVCIDPLPNLTRTPAYTYAASIHEVALGGAYLAGHRPTQEDFAVMGRDLIARIARGQLDPMIEHRITLNEVPEYLWRLRQGRLAGKTVATLV
jgi:NADPH:quinone reductase-like Zn-dependent oxidoreductase